MVYALLFDQTIIVICGLFLPMLLISECPLGSKAWRWKAPVSYSQLQAHQDTPVSVQIQAEWGFEQPALVEGVPGHGRGLELGDL